MKIKITADSTCDLSPQLIQDYDIEIVPLSIQIGYDSFKDGLEISSSQVVSSFEEQGVLAKTAAVSVGEYIELFQKWHNLGYHVIHVNIGSEFSSCCQNALLAAEEVGEITVIDSQNLSTGQGHIVIKAAAMAKDGKTPEEIKNFMEDYVNRVDASFLLDTLTYLHKGGRCSAVAALGANLLKLKPCIEVKNGKMGVGKKYRGELKKCYRQYIKDRLSQIENLEDGLIFVTHSPCRQDIIDTAMEEVEQYNYFKSIEKTAAGCTVVSHCGPNTLGILYIRK
ncbi:MAG: DegV family protein [Bacillota bacterium]|nr:DegV family protein [Bacillota bacterium]